jgi:zinc transport system ATP-binding protein
VVRESHPREPESPVGRPALNECVGHTHGHSHGTTPGDVLVEFRDVCVSLGERDILRGVNARLLRHKITALIGLNGAGKSTLLRALVREIPYVGEIRFHCGHDHSRPSPEHVGYVPQKLRIESSLPLTVMDLFGIALQRWPIFLGVSRSTRSRALKQLEEVGAAHLLKQPVEKLSGGELQRVLLALALEPRPELLLLDEPAAGIDFQEVGKFHDLIVELNARTGVTILLVSHDIGVVSKMAHHVMCLQDGRIQCEGPPQDIGEMLAQTFGADKGLFAHSHGGG